MTKLEETVRAVCFQYSEWLDHGGLMMAEEGDERSHEDLVAEFMKERHEEGYLPKLGHS